MDIASLIRYRLDELGIEQRDLAVAAGVTESYISQLLAKKKMPPAPDRTKIYEKIGKVLKLPSKELSRLAETQRREELKRKVLAPPRPLFEGLRQLVLRKCVPAKKKQITGIFEREPFGEFERFITQRLLDVAKGLAKKEFDDKDWIRRVAQVSKRSDEQMRAVIIELLGTDVFRISAESCTAVLDPLIHTWDIDLGSFGMEVVLSRRLTQSEVKRFEFREMEPEHTPEVEPALEEFLRDTTLSAGLSKDEAVFLGRLRTEGRRPSVLYYYRELQNLRDPLNFLPVSIGSAESKTPVRERRRARRQVQGRSGR